MIPQKINKILKIILGIDFLVCALTGLLMELRILQINLKGIHLVSGFILLVLGTIHIISHCKLKK